MAYQEHSHGMTGWTEHKVESEEKTAASQERSGALKEGRETFTAHSSCSGSRQIWA